MLSDILKRHNAAKPLRSADVRRLEKRRQTSFVEQFKKSATNFTNKE
jgi:hypothetical protein